MHGGPGKRLCSLVCPLVQILQELLVRHARQNGHAAEINQSLRQADHNGVHAAFVSRQSDLIAAFAQHDIGQVRMCALGKGDHIGRGNAERRKRLRLTRCVGLHGMDIVRLGFAGQRQHILPCGLDGLIGRPLVHVIGM